MAALVRFGCIFCILILIISGSYSDEFSPFEIVVSFQRYTYLVEHPEPIDDIYFCEPDREFCRVNLDFRDSFSVDWPQKNFICELEVSFDPSYVVVDPCNPPGLIIPDGTHHITIRIRSKSDEQFVHSRELTFVRDTGEQEEPISTGTGSIIDVGDETTIKPDISQVQPTIRIQSGLDASYRCKKSDCKMNLIVENVPDGYACLWDFGGGTFVTANTDRNCNPGYVTYSPGVYQVHLTVYHTRFPEYFVMQSREVTNLPAGISPDQDIALRARIEVQGVLGKNKQLRGNTLTCIAKSQCSVNLDGRASEGSIVSYVWDFGDGETLVGNNPKARYFGLGRHRVSLTVYNHDAEFHTTIFTILVSSDQPQDIGPIQAKISLQGVLGKNKILEGNHLTCLTKDTCSLNFDGSKSQGPIRTYSWDFGDGNTSSLPNPPAYRAPQGTYTIRLMVTGTDGSTSVDTFVVDVVDPRFKLIDEQCPEGGCIHDERTVKIILSAVLPNPHHKDVNEWIELTNPINDRISLWGCELDDIPDGGSTPFSLNGISLAPGSKTRFYKPQTKLNLNNTGDEAVFRCNGHDISRIYWSFSVPSGYILRQDTSSRRPVRVLVVRVIDGDTIQIQLDGGRKTVRLLGVDTPETVHPHKSVEHFGQQASAFTRSQLEGSWVWISFDHTPLDSYGRLLGYVWQGTCDVFGDSSISVYDLVGRQTSGNTDCSLFNARLLDEGYARMERRFGFAFYDVFNSIEKNARKTGRGMWIDTQVRKILDQISKEEKELYELDREIEFQDDQQQYIEDILLSQDHDDTLHLSDIEMNVTKSFSSIHVTQRKDTSIRISGHTWANRPVRVDVNTKSYFLLTDQKGSYVHVLIPDRLGEMRIQAFVQTQSGHVGIGEKQVIVETLLPNFTTPLEANIIVQGKMSKNRWLRGDTFFCRSRKGCAYNVDVDVGGRKYLEYIWEFSTGQVFTKKNPTSVKMPHGIHTVVLTITDTLTSESITRSMQIRSLGLLTKKKITRTASVKKARLITDDYGGGASGQEGTPDRIPWGFRIAFFVFLGIAIVRWVPKLF